VRVLIVDDHEIFRDGLRTVIESRAGALVVGEASSVREATRHLDALEFDLLILDLTMPGLNGFAFLREMRRRRCRQRVLVLTMHGEAELVVEALAAGAMGFALKSDSAASLLQAVDCVFRGERFIAAGLPLETIERLLQARPDSPDAPDPLSVLSTREREIFQLLMRGYRNDAIAAELCISFKTVVTHRGHVFLKLGVHSIGELLRFGFRHQLFNADADPVRPAATKRPS
jgi:DNA-binding NarL/FixJ family response regulator